MIAIPLGLLFAAPTMAQDWEQVGHINNWGVECLYADSVDGNLYVGGGFKYFWSVPANGIFRMDNTGATYTLGSGQDFCDNYSCTPVKTIFRYKDEHYVGWTNKTIGGGVVVNGIARWDGSVWKPLGNGFIEGGSFNGAMEYDGELYTAGGLDVVVGTDTAWGIAKWNGSEWASLGFPNFQGSFPIGGDMAFYQGDLYFGGNFLFGIGNSDYILDIARYDGQTWWPVEEGIKGGFWHGIAEMTVYKGELYVCGSFRAIDGNVGNKIMRWNGEQWKDVGGGICDHGATVHRMLIHNDKLYVVGNFTCVGNGIPASNIAVWDGEKWCSVGNSVFDNRILTVAFWNNDLYIGGGFTEIDDQPVKYFAKWVGDHSTDTCSAPVVAAPEPHKASVTDISISPNPAHSAVTLALEGEAWNSKPVRFSIFNALGQQVWSVVSASEREELSLAGWPAGVYVARAESERDVAAKVFVKE